MLSVWQNQGSIVYTPTDFCLDDAEIQSWQQQDTFVSSETSRTALVSIQAPINGYRGYFSWVKRPRHKVDHLTPSSVDGKGEWSYICCVIVAWPGTALTFIF